MRIISGIHKGRKFSAPKNLPVRPTTDMAKEGLFNILSNQYYFDKVSVLDLFAGIGSISLEFGSRGCPNITSVDKHYGCVKFIEETASQLNLPLKVIKGDVFKYLKTLSHKHSIIFADPPYNFDDDVFKSIIDLVISKQLLEEDGILIIEHSKHTDLSFSPYHDNSRNYGGNVFSFFRYHQPLIVK